MEAPAIIYKTEDNILYNIVENIKYAIKYKKNRYLYIDDIYTFNRIKSDWKRHDKDGYMLYILSNIDRKYLSGTYYLRKKHLCITKNTQWKVINRRPSIILDNKVEVDIKKFQSSENKLYKTIHKDVINRKIDIDRINKMSIADLQTIKGRIDERLCKLTEATTQQIHEDINSCIYVEPMKKINIPIYKTMCRDDAILDINLRRARILHS